MEDYNLDLEKLDRDIKEAMKELDEKLKTFHHELAEIQSHGIPAPIKKTELDLTGNYSVANKTLTRDDGKQLFLGRREKAVGKKPKDFLLLIKGSKKSYCSSLFPSLKSQGSFNLDYENKKYLLTFMDNGSKAIIQRRCSTKMAFSS